MSYLEALEDAADERRAPVDPETARGRMRAASAPEQVGFLDDDARFAIARTARAAGKTSAMVSDVLEQISTVDNWRGCYGALTQDSGKEQLWDELRRQDKEFGFGIKFHEHDATVVYPPTGGRLKVRDVSSIRAVNKWRGKQYHRVYLDECQSMADEVLAYAVVVVLPPTLSRHRGKMRLAGTPRRRCDGWWYEVSSKKGLEVNVQPDGSRRALARKYSERDNPELAGITWSWSLHHWPRASNPGLPDADREADEMRRALAVTAADIEALSVELDGEWPDEDQEPRLYRFNEDLDCWDVIAGPEQLYGLAPEHSWGFFLGADLALKRDAFSLELGACAPTTNVAYHCDEVHERGLSIAQMAAHISRFRAQLGPRLIAIVGDSSGPTGKDIFDELRRVHGIPIEKAEKQYKDDGVELVSSDLHAKRMKIRRGSVLAAQLKRLQRPKPEKSAGKQPHQDDDAADAWLYARRRMTHGFSKPPAAPPTTEDLRAEERRRQLRALAARRKQEMNPLASLRKLGGIGQGKRPW